MVKRLIAVLFAVAMLFSVTLTPANAHKVVRCETERKWDYNAGRVVVTERCECVEHKHGNTMEGDSVPTDETPEGGTPAV